MTLDGEWHNEHGTKMVLRRDGRLVRGSCHTAVGLASGIYEVIGAIDDDDGPSASIGLVVVWQNAGGNSHSVTAWSGQLHRLDDEELLSTTWLLTTEGANEWLATQVGRDEFRRGAPAPSARATSHRLNPRSHPVSR